MPIVAWLLNSLLPVLTAWVVSFFTRKIMVVGITISSFLMLTAAFLVCIKKMVTIVLALAVMPAWITSAVGMFLPYNLAIILANILSAQSCRWAYDKAIDKIKMINGAT